MRRRPLLALAGAALATSCARWSQPRVPIGRVVAALDSMPPAVPREFRAAWVATVANIDWPSRKGLSMAEQQAEMLVLLDRAQAIGLNAIILQVRPSADAIYPSALEPWTEFLGGAQGLDPGWDPLARWIDEAHVRGLELHAWFNPYRARAAPATSAFAAPHLAVTQPSLVRRYGDLHWIDPGEPAAAEHTLAVINDVLRRYDVDGIHIDDYFYPYPIEADGREQPFPDEPSWQRYRADGGRLARAEWRRGNVDQLVERMHRAVRTEKPWVKFGISPFGIGRPDRRPPGISGFSQLDKLHADVERWLVAGWLDYLAPQLYWPIAQKAQAFGVLFDYWHATNPLGRHIWPGLYTSRLPAAEVLAQIELMRERRPAEGGHAHFSMVALLQNREGLADRLRARPYATAALVPASPWLGTGEPPVPVLRVHRAAGGNGVRVEFEPAADVARRVLWLRDAGVWQLRIEPASSSVIDLTGPIDALVVSAVNRLGHESARIALDLRAS